MDLEKGTHIREMIQMAREVNMGKLCMKCGEESMVAFMTPSGPLFYECKSCGLFWKYPKLFDIFYDKDKIIAYFQKRYSEGKTEEEKRELLENLLSSRSSYLNSEGSCNGKGVIVLKPEVIPFYQSYTTETWVSNYFGLSDMRERSSMRWTRPIKYPIIQEKEVETIYEVVDKFQQGTGLSEAQQRAKKLLEADVKKSISELLESIYEESSKSLTVWGFVHDMRYIKSPDPTVNRSYQIVFSYPELEILGTGRCW